MTTRSLPIVGCDEVLDFVRPKRREDCVGAIRPCPWAGCEFSLLADINRRTGTVSFLGDPETMTETCVLDVVERGGDTLERVGAIYRLTRERVRQVEMSALAKLKDRLDEEMVSGWTHVDASSVEETLGDIVNSDFKAAVQRAYERIVPAAERGTQLLRGKPSEAQGEP